MRLGWIVYHYPVLSQVKLSLTRARSLLPAVQNRFDKKVERNEPLPDNVIRPQQSRYDAPYLRISLQFPNTPPGDGDGLCELRATKLHGLFVNDEKVDSVLEFNIKWRVYPSSFRQIEGVPSNLIEMQSRLFGYDTQEAPRGTEEGTVMSQNLCGAREGNFYRRNLLKSKET